MRNKFFISAVLIGIGAVPNQILTAAPASTNFESSTTPVKTGPAARKSDPSPADYRAFHQKLSKEEQEVHALERLTFGPRPSDVDSIRKLGVKKWIDLQLHPERIEENPELAKRLEPLESLRLSPSDVARRYPNPQMIRAIAMGREKMPDDPVTRAAVERLLSRFEARKKAEAANAAPPGGTSGNPAANPNAAGDNGPLEAPQRLQDFFTPYEIQALRNGTFEEKRAILSAIPKDEFDDVAIALPPGLRFQLLPAAAPELRRKMMLMNAPQQLVAFDLLEGKLYRAILSNRQLEEELTDFWYNHFNIFLDKGADRFLAPGYERDAIRPRVLGHFRDLLEATATSPAMLFYLDNWQSAAPDQNRRPQGKRPARGLNENYARELMELHTLGVDGGYTQKDVTEVARCFTGWTIRAPREGGGFFFNEKMHDKGEKIVLGVKIPAGGGRDDGEKVLDILARHPSTARFISTKLAERFVADNPPPRLIEKMARTFQQTNGDIRAVMKTMLTSDEFFSRGAYQAKIKTPLEMVVSAVRVTGADVDFAFALANRLNQLGQPLYRKIEPTGYSNLSDEWVNSAALLARMNFALDLVEGRVPGVRVDETKFAAQDAPVIAKMLLLRDASSPTIAAVEGAIADQRRKVEDGAAGLQPNDEPLSGFKLANSKGAQTRTRTVALEPQQGSRPLGPGVLAAGLLLGSPEFQRR